MKNRSRAKKVSNEFERVMLGLKKEGVYPNLQIPDKLDPNNEAPDLFFPDERLVIELKSISMNEESGLTAGQQIRKAKKNRHMQLYGTARIEFTQKEASILSALTSGTLKMRLKKADSQLANFVKEEQLFAATVIFIETSEKQVRNWDERSRPSRDMVRRVTDEAMKKLNVDAYAIFCLDELDKLSLDVMQTVYADGYFENEFDEFIKILTFACRALPYAQDFSEKPAIYFERTT